MINRKRRTKEERKRAWDEFWMGVGLKVSSAIDLLSSRGNRGTLSARFNNWSDLEPADQDLDNDSEKKEKP